MRAIHLDASIAALLSSLCERKNSDGFISEESVRTVERGLRCELSDTVIAALIAGPCKLSDAWKLLSPRGCIYESRNMSLGRNAPIVLASNSLDKLKWLQVARQERGSDPVVEECRFTEPGLGATVLASRSFSSWLGEQGVVPAQTLVAFRVGDPVSVEQRKGAKVRHSTFGDGEVLRCVDEVCDVQFTDTVRRVHERFLTWTADE